MTIQEHYYDLKFQNEFLRAKGIEFQRLFERLMGLAFKEDFLPCCPWGNRGDRKNDGFLKSDKRLFQVYAPHELDEKTTIAKIKEDFEGAKHHWGTLFDKWSFVHNAQDGLPPHVIKVLLDFENDNPGITISPCGYNELLNVFHKLSHADCAELYGPAPTEETKAKLGFEDLKVVIESIAYKHDYHDLPVKDIPLGKIEVNDLSLDVAALIKCGMTKASLVHDFFCQWHDETLAEKLANAFHDKYLALKGTKHPNLIFSELQEWAGGDQIGTAEKQMAVLTVLAYFFEKCDIFEEPHKN